jgi:hypothetical protein
MYYFQCAGFAVLKYSILFHVILSFLLVRIFLLTLDFGSTYKMLILWCSCLSALLPKQKSGQLPQAAQSLGQAGIFREMPSFRTSRNGATGKFYPASPALRFCL